MTEEVKRIIEDHTNGDRIRWQSLVWVVLLIVVIVTVFSTVVYVDSRKVRSLANGVERATCTLVRTLEGTAERSHRRAVIAQRTIRRVPVVSPEQERLRQESLRAYIESRNFSQRLADDLRVDVHCPPPKPAE